MSKKEAADESMPTGKDIPNLFRRLRVFTGEPDRKEPDHIKGRRPQMLPTEDSTDSNGEDVSDVPGRRQDDFNSSFG